MSTIIHQLNLRIFFKENKIRTHNSTNVSSRQHQKIFVVLHPQQPYCSPIALHNIINTFRSKSFYHTTQWLCRQWLWSPRPKRQRNKEIHHERKQITIIIPSDIFKFCAKFVIVPLFCRTMLAVLRFSKTLRIACITPRTCLADQSRGGPVRLCHDGHEVVSCDLNFC